MAGKRTNKTFVIKTLRFAPEQVQDIERVLEFTQPRYPSFNNFVVVALSKLVKEERRELEKEGIVWEHLRHGNNKS